jgi:predicted phage gp36 major capsid-like protein
MGRRAAAIFVVTVSLSWPLWRVCLGDGEAGGEVVQDALQSANAAISDCMANVIDRAGQAVTGEVDQVEGAVGEQRADRPANFDRDTVFMRTHFTTAARWVQGRSAPSPGPESLCRMTWANACSGGAGTRDYLAR